MAISLIEQIAERLNVHPDEAQTALSSLVQYIRLKATVGESFTIQGLGTFEMGEHQLTFAQDPALSDLVNHRFSGYESRALTPQIEVALPALEEDEAVGPSDTISPPEPVPIDDLEPSSMLEEPQEVGSSTGDEAAFVALPEDVSEEEPLWEESSIEDPAHPLGPLPTPTFEDADFSVVENSVATPPEDSPFLNVGGENADSDAPGEAFDILQYPPPPPVEAPPIQAAESEETAAIPAALDRTASPPNADAPQDQRTASRSKIWWGVFVVLALILGSTAGYFLLKPETETVPPAVVITQPPLPAPSSPADSQRTSTPIPAALDTTAVSSTPAPLPPREPPVSESPPISPPPATGLNGGIDRSAGGYALIVASAVGQTQALDFLQGLAGFEMPADILTSTDAEGVTRYRIGLGQFPTVEAAQTAQQDMADRLPDGTWILRIKADM